MDINKVSVDINEHPMGYRISRFLARNYLGLFFTYYATLVSESLLAWLSMVCFGLIVDLGRKKFVPELNEPNEKLWERFDQARNNPVFMPTLNISKRPIASLFWATWIYYVAIISLHRFYGSEFMSGYFAQFEGFTTFMTHFSRRHENLLYELERVEFYQMIPLTDHAYAVAHAGMMTVMVLVFCFGGMKTLGKNWRHDKIKSRIEGPKKYRRSVFGLLFLSMSAGIFFELVTDTQCEFKSHIVDICVSQFNYYVDTFFYFAAIFLGQIFIYQMLLISMMLSSQRSDGS